MPFFEDDFDVEGATENIRSAFQQGRLMQDMGEDLTDLRFGVGRHMDNKRDDVASGLYHLNYTPTIALPVSSVGGKARAMPAHRQAFPTPRGDGKSDPEGGVARLPDVVAHRLWWDGTMARHAPSRKPRNAVVGVQFR